MKSKVVVESMFDVFDHTHDHLVMSIYLDTDHATQKSREQELKGLMETEFHRNDRLRGLDSLSRTVIDATLDKVRELQTSPKSLAIFISFCPEHERRKVEDMEYLIVTSELPSNLDRSYIFLSDIPDVRLLANAQYRSQGAVVASIHRDVATFYTYDEGTFELIEDMINTRIDTDRPNVEADTKPSINTTVDSAQVGRGQNPDEYYHGVGSSTIENRKLDQDQTFVIQVMKRLRVLAESRGIDMVVVSAAENLKQWVSEYADYLNQASLHVLEENYSDRTSLEEGVKILMKDRTRDLREYFAEVTPELKTEDLGETLQALQMKNVELQLLDPESETWPSLKQIGTYLESEIPEGRSLESHIAYLAIRQGGDVAVTQDENSQTPVWTIRRFTTN